MKLKAWLFRESEARDFKQKDLAADPRIVAAGITQPMLSLYGNGDRMPTAAHKKAIAEATNGEVDTWELRSSATKRKGVPA